MTFKNDKKMTKNLDVADCVCHKHVKFHFK
jgi:hypothetical protein